MQNQDSLFVEIFGQNNITYDRFQDTRYMQSQTFLWKKSVPFNFEETYTYYISLESKLAVVSEFQGLEPPFLAIFFKKLNMCEKIGVFYENERENASTRGKQT